MHTHQLVRPHRGRFLALCITFGLALSCLNPDISDEEPITETAAALGAPDAGSADLDQPSDTADDDAPSDDAADTPPTDDTAQPPRRERGRRNPFGR